MLTQSENNMVSSAIERTWSDEQKAIFDFVATEQGNGVFVARAGCGKTTTSIESFKYTKASRILYGQFAKKNQLDAQSKVSDVRIDVLTWHAFGRRAIVAHWGNITLDNRVEFDRAKEACGASAPFNVIGACAKLSELAKNHFLMPSIDALVQLAESKDIDCGEVESLGWDIMRLAECALQVLELSRKRDKLGRITFADMAWVAAVNHFVRADYDLVLGDEAQDLNIVQFTLALHAVKANGRLIMVGDDRQAIYSWRGAMASAIDNMQKQLSAKVLPLTYTYRCAKAIVKEANKYVPDLKAATNNPEGAIFNINTTQLMTWVKSGNAILSRTNAPLMPICLALLRQGIPAKIEGKDIAKRLLAVVKQIKAASIPQLIARLNAWADKQRARSAKDENAETRNVEINDTKDTLIAIAEGCTGMPEFIARLDPENAKSLFADTDGKFAGITLSSTHKAKGLEWDRVALLWSTYRANGCTVGEEANLCYVGITRARNELAYVRD